MLCRNTHHHNYYSTEQSPRIIIFPYNIPNERPNFDLCDGADSSAIIESGRVSSSLNERSTQARSRDFQISQRKKEETGYLAGGLDDGAYDVLVGMMMISQRRQRQGQRDFKNVKKYLLEMLIHFDSQLVCILAGNAILGILLVKVRGTYYVLHTYTLNRAVQLTLFTFPFTLLLFMILGYR